MYEYTGKYIIEEKRKISDTNVCVLCMCKTFVNTSK